MVDMAKVKYQLGELIESKAVEPVGGLSEEDVDRIGILTIDACEFFKISDRLKYIGVTDEFKNVIAAFKQADGKIPAGFRPEFVIKGGNALFVDLKRDISYDKDGQKRPTRVLFSADSANPYEVAPLKDFVANLTCNPAIIYNLFINNPKANIGNKFKDRYEVIAELANVLGPGADISVEVDDPFADESVIFEEIEKFKEILTPYRLVIKIPHTGAVNRENVGQLVDNSFLKKYNEGSLADNMLGHNLAYKLYEKGYKVNFTLMFEPYQVALALQTRPYFINTFIKHRMRCSFNMKGLVDAYRATNNFEYLQRLREYMLANDYLSKNEESVDLVFVLKEAEKVMQYRQLDGEGADGLDSTRHSLRVLRNSNLEDTRLIICSMDQDIYPGIDKMLMEPEFEDMLHRVVITAPPAYLAQFAGAPGVLTYQRVFAKAAN